MLINHSNHPQRSDINAYCRACEELTPVSNFSVDQYFVRTGVRETIGVQRCARLVVIRTIVLFGKASQEMRYRCSISVMARFTINLGGTQLYEP